MNAVAGPISCIVACVLSLLALVPRQSPSPQPITPENADQVIQLTELQGHTGAVYTVAWSPDGNLIASGSQDQTVRVWNAHSHETLLTLHGHNAAVWGVAFSPDSSLLASASQDGTVRLWDTQTGEEQQQFSTRAWAFSAA